MIDPKSNMILRHAARLVSCEWMSYDLEFVDAMNKAELVNVTTVHHLSCCAAIAQAANECPPYLVLPPRKIESALSYYFNPSRRDVSDYWLGDPSGIEGEPSMKIAQANQERRVFALLLLAEIEE